MAVRGRLDISDVVKDLRSLEPRLQKKILRKATRAGCKPIAKAAKADAPVLSGQARKAIKVRAAKRSRKRKSITTFVQNAAGDYKGSTYYAAFQEYGYRLGPRRLGDKRRKVEGKEFMKKGFDQGRGQAEKEVKREIREGIEREMKAGKR